MHWLARHSAAVPKGFFCLLLLLSCTLLLCVCFRFLGWSVFSALSFHGYAQQFQQLGGLSQDLIARVDSKMWCGQFRPCVCVLLFLVQDVLPFAFSWWFGRLFRAFVRGTVPSVRSLPSLLLPPFRKDRRMHPARCDS